MNNQPRHIDPETGSAIFSHIAPESPLLHAPAGESTHADVNTPNDDPRRSTSVHWSRHLAVFPLQQGKPSAASEAIEVLGDLEETAPHVLALLSRVWGKPEAARAFRTLFLAANGRVRRWAPAVWAELVLLRNVHQTLCPCPAPDAASASWAAAMPDPACIPELESGFQHVVDRLLKCWGNVEAFAVVHHDLIFDNRGDRAGWPVEVWNDLVLLQDVHEQVYGKLAPGAEPWKSFFLNP